MAINFDIVPSFPVSEHIQPHALYRQYEIYSIIQKMTHSIIFIVLGVLNICLIQKKTEKVNMINKKKRPG